MAEKKKAGFSVIGYEQLAGSEPGTSVIKMSAKRFGQPAKRLTIASSGLSVTTALIRNLSRNKTIDYEISRINRLPTKNQTRIHTAALLYPGDYEITLTITGKIPDNLADLIS